MVYFREGKVNIYVMIMFESSSDKRIRLNAENCNISSEPNQFSREHNFNGNYYLLLKWSQNNPT